MAASNDITGDQIKSRILNKEGRDNWDKIFGKKNKEKENERASTKELADKKKGV